MKIHLPALSKAFILAPLFLFSPNAFASGPNAISGNVVQVKDNVEIKAGETRSHVLSLGGSVRIDGTVEESAIALFADIVVGPSGLIQGDAVSIGGRVIREPGGRINGKEVTLGVPVNGISDILMMSTPMMAAAAASAFAMAAVLSSIGFIGIIVVVLTLFERQTVRVSKELGNHPIRSFLLGLFGFGCLFPILTFLVLTLIGIPLAFAVAVVAVAALVLGVVGVGLWIGTAFSDRFKWHLQPVWAGLLGFAVLLVVSFVPVLGWLAHTCALFFGFGSAIATRMKV